jgi:hypothetical protein
MQKPHNRNQIIQQNYHHNGSTINDPTLTAQNFNIFFTNIGPNLASKIPDININPIHYLTGNYAHSLFFSPTDVHEINSLLTIINVNKSAGPDGLHPTVIKNVAQYISPMLAHIFINSLETGIVPERLKIAKIPPIYKSEDQMEFANYCPISILPIISRILKKISFKETS